jgi:hypothetical protein
MQQLAKGVDAGRRSLSVAPWRTPDLCPFCKRERIPSGNQCRTNGELFSCLEPNNAKPGTVYQTPDGPYYLTSKRGGYSGGHTIYARHRDAAAFDFHAARRIGDPVSTGLPALLQQAKGVRDAVARVRAQLSLEHATLEELRAYEHALRLVEQRLGAFDEALRDVRVTNPKVTQLRAAVADWKRQLRYARADMDRFLQHLGTPSRAETVR